MAARRVVFDTNVLVSAFLSRTSTPAQALAHAIAHDQLLASDATVRELIRVISITKVRSIRAARAAERASPAVRSAR